MAMMDGSGEEAHVLIRGNASAPGARIPRRFLRAMSEGESLGTREGSGRLALAERVVDPSNPLASRVFVNRVWHHLLGRGIVPTTDDFGVAGQRPSHSALLDHLASRFDRRGRRIKDLIRYVVLSRTYRMS